jgi:hypothetical protein
MSNTSLSTKRRTLLRRVATLAIFICLASSSARLAEARAVLDFDGDGKTDYAVTHFSGELMEWFVAQSNGGVIAQQFGMNGPTSGIRDNALTEDFDGDGKCDIAVYRFGDPLMLYILESQTNTFRALPFSGYHFLGATQDYDGDGKADPAEAYFELGSPNLIWRINESRTGNLRRVHFGNYFTDKALKGDFDGDGKADIAVYRRDVGTPANTFFVLRSSDGEVQAQTFGNGQVDYFVDGDFDGDGKNDFAAWRGFGTATDGVWYWIESSTGAYRSLAFGRGGSDEPAPGDYDGDGKTDQAVMRREFGNDIFYVNRSTGGITATHWGFDALPLARNYAY